MFLFLVALKKRKKNDKWYWFYKDHDFQKWESFNLMIIQVLEYCIILHIIIQKYTFLKINIIFKEMIF